ncbi:MAG: hypothetical protein IT574_11225 [Candidatus Aureabacteria bacterium]|jgi:hypothetical protein|nr:hypothetical protein [Candidatus Auribacterota bacterium]HOE27001.1 hypothetical protein [bacterium]HQM52413.1 hypothetical protein [bacterium]
MAFLKQYAFTILSVLCAVIILGVEEIGGFCLFAPSDRLYLDIVISALIIGEGVLLDDAMRRLARERMLKEVLRSVNETLAKERGELEESLERIRLLSGLLPICSSCKRIRDDEGSWRQIEEYIGAHSEATFTHGICPECARRLYPRSFEDDIA